MRRRHPSSINLFILVILASVLTAVSPGTIVTPAFAATPSDGEVSILFVGGDLVVGQCSGGQVVRDDWRDNVLNQLMQDYIVSAVGTQWGPEPSCYRHPDRSHEGYPGQRADELVTTLQASLPNVVGVPDFVIVAAGTEDLEDGQDVPSTKADLQAILGELSAAFPNATNAQSSLLEPTPTIPLDRENENNKGGITPSHVFAKIELF